MVAFVAQQISASPTALADYALRDQTRREHAVELQKMSRRAILSAEQRARLFGIPTDPAEMAKHYVARAGLAMTLLRLGEEEAALGHFRAMLKLNPNDNQGIRYLLLACLLRRDDAEAVKALLADYDDEWSAHWLYTRALMAYRNGAAADAATLKLVQDARSSNEHVPGILAGTAPPVISTGGYVTVGGPDEATDYVRECGPAWKAAPGAIAWLTSTVAALPKNPKRGRAAH